MEREKVSELFEIVDENKIRCLSCNHKCVIREGGKGFCKVRTNTSQKLYVPYNYISAINIDPVEKKPVYHFMPGSRTLSFGMLGCNFRCLYCQNYDISQDYDFSCIREITSDEIVNIAYENGIDIIVSTYNEPVISIEWAKEIFEKFKKRIKGAKTGFVSNGYISTRSLDYISDYIDFIRVDLKSFNNERFKELTSANLTLLLESIKEIYKRKIHLEIVTLVVEGFNDGKEEFEGMIDFIKSLSPQIPWHLTRFHPDYKMSDFKPTEISKLESMIEYAKSKGLYYVYGGNYYTKNLNTYCPQCKSLIFKRGYMNLKSSYITPSGTCPDCGFKIYGVF